MSPVIAFVLGHLTAEVAENRATAVAVHGIAAGFEFNDESARRIGAPLVVVLQFRILKDIRLLLLADVLDLHAVIVSLRVFRDLVHSSTEEK